MDQVQLQKLLNKQNKSQKQMQEIVKFIRQGSLDMPDASFQYSYKLLSKDSNSEQRFLNVDELIHSGLQLKIPTITLKIYLNWFLQKIGEVPYLKRLMPFINYVTSEPDIKHFDNIIKQDLTDNDSKKKSLTFYKREGRNDQYLKKINEYLEDNPTDEEAWIQLSLIYTEKGQYLRAIFCLEQLITISPDNDHYATKLAQLYYTLGGKSNISAAIKYFSLVIAKSPKNYRALWGLNKALNSEGCIQEQQYAQLKEKTQETLKKFYKQNTALKIDKAF